MNEQNAYYEDACQILEHASLFKGLDRDTRCSMVSECQAVTWKKAETLNPDISMTYLYIILEGKMKVTQVDPESGRSVSLFLLSSGDIFDTFTLLDGKEHIVFPIPMSNMKLLRIPIVRAREWIREFPKFNEAFLPYLGEQLRQLESFSQSLVFHDTTTRLANLILHHTGQHPDEQEGHYPVRLINNLSHESLAELIGSVRSVVSTQMQKLKEEEIILSKRGKLVVKDLKKLMQRCDVFYKGKI